jgi:hypothetical protein
MTSPGSVMKGGSQPRKVSLIRRLGRWRRRAGEEEPSQVCPILVPPNQLANVFTAGAITALLDLLVDECPQSLGQRDVHGAHGRKLDGMAKFGKHLAGLELSNVPSRRFS